MRPKIVAILNQKGGVGKTTTSVNLSHALAKMGYKVTVIDLDPQGHLAVSFGQVSSRVSGIDDVMLGQTRLQNQTFEIRENLKLVVAGPRLQEIEQLNEGGVHRGQLLKEALDADSEDDYIFIDCPPSSGILVANALFAAEDILIPMTGDYLSLQGLAFLMGTIKRFEKTLGKKYKISLVMSRFSTTRRMSREVLNTIRKHFPTQVLATVIREAALLAECPGLGKTIHDYRASSRSAQDFRNLAQDFVESRMM